MLAPPLVLCSVPTPSGWTPLVGALRALGCLGGPGGAVAWIYDKTGERWGLIAAPHAFGAVPPLEFSRTRAELHAGGGRENAPFVAMPAAADGALVAAL